VGGVHLVAGGRVPLGLNSALAFALAFGLAALLTAKRPAFGIAALLVLDPFAWAHDIGPTQITFPKAALLGVLLGLLMRRASLAALRDPAARPLVGGALAIVAVTALTAIPATYVDAVARETLKALEYLLAFGVAAVAIAGAGDEEVVLAAVLGGSALVCFSALAQYVTGAPSGALIEGRVIPRIAGLLDGPNQLAGYLDLAIPVLLAAALARRKLRGLTLAVLAVAIATDVLTLSRAGLLGMAAGIVVVLALRARGTRLAGGLAAGGVVLAAALAAFAARRGFLQRFFTVGEVSRENGLATRSELWHAALTLWRTDPALGVGAGNFELLLPSAGLIGVRTHANSLYLQSLAEGGLALLFAVLWTLVAALAMCWREAPRSALLLGVGAATFGFAAHQVFDVLTFFPKAGGFWWLLLGAGTGRAHALRARSA
jgi:O-antigen ligase